MRLQHTTARSFELNNFASLTWIEIVLWRILVQLLELNRPDETSFGVVDPH